MRLRARLGLATLAFFVGVTSAAAQSTDEPAGDEWLVRVAPYLWATSLDGDAEVKGVKADVDVPFSDILKDLAFAGMLVVDVQKGRFGVGVNGVFARVARSSLRLPIVVITGHDAPGMEVRCLAAGASAHLRKPLEAGTLLAAIEAAVAHAS